MVTGNYATDVIATCRKTPEETFSYSMLLGPVEWSEGNHAEFLKHICLSTGSSAVTVRTDGWVHLDRRLTPESIENALKDLDIDVGLKE